MAAQVSPFVLTPEPVVLVGTYRLTYQPNSTDKTTRTDLMYLLLGKGASEFESRAKWLSDSTVAAYKDVPFTQENAQLAAAQLSALPHSRFHYVIYKTPDRHLYYYTQLGLNYYRYEEPTAALAWVTAPEQATIGGYACQRATATYGGRTWEAWFTRAVPVADGPYKFSGLPGLIVRVADTRQHYTFELLRLRKPTTPGQVALPTKVTTSTTKANFRRAQADFNVDPLGRMAPGASGGAGIIVQNPEEVQQRMRERNKKNNNPLELK